MPDAGIGQVTIRVPEVAAGSVGGRFVLLHVPTNRFVELNESAEQIWHAIEQGTRDLRALIQDHSSRTQSPIEVAAFDVLAFLDDLRALQFVELPDHLVLGEPRVLSQQREERGGQQAPLVLRVRQPGLTSWARHRHCIPMIVPDAEELAGEGGPGPGVVVP